MGLWILAVLVWAYWIQHDVMNSGRSSEPLRLTLFTGGGPVEDYRKARRIARRRRHKPWYLACFAWLACLGMAGIVTVIGYLCVVSFR